MYVTNEEGRTESTITQGGCALFSFPLGHQCSADGWLMQGSIADKKGYDGAHWSFLLVRV